MIVICTIHLYSKYPYTTVSQEIFDVKICVVSKIKKGHEHSDPSSPLPIQLAMHENYYKLPTCPVH